MNGKFWYGLAVAAFTLAAAGAWGAWGTLRSVETSVESIEKRMDRMDARVTENARRAHEHPWPR